MQIYRMVKNLGLAALLLMYATTAMAASFMVKKYDMDPKKDDIFEFSDAQIVQLMEQSDEEQICSFWKAMFVAYMKHKDFENAERALQQMEEISSESCQPTESNLYVTDIPARDGSFNIHNASFEDFRADFRFYQKLNELASDWNNGETEKVFKTVERLVDYTGKNSCLGHRLQQIRRTADEIQASSGDGLGESSLLKALLEAPPYFAVVPEGERSIQSEDYSNDFSVGTFAVSCSPVTIAELILCGRENKGKLPPWVQLGRVINDYSGPGHWGHTALGFRPDLLPNFLSWAGTTVPTVEEWWAAYQGGDRPIVNVHPYGERLKVDLEMNPNWLGIPMYYGVVYQIVAEDRNCSVAPGSKINDKCFGETGDNANAQYTELGKDKFKNTFYDLRGVSRDRAGLRTIIRY